MSLLRLLLLLIVPFLLLSTTNFGTFCAGESLKLHVNFENANKNGRKTEMQLFFNLDKQRATNLKPIPIQNGQNFEIAIPNAEQIVEFELVFECRAKPLAGEKIPPPTIQSDENFADDQQNDQSSVAADQANIQSLIRVIRVLIYKPDFSKRHYINLGSVEPSELYWHRRVLVEMADNDATPNGSYHALLHAVVQENRAQQQNGEAAENNANGSNNNNNDGQDKKQALLGYAMLNRVGQAKDGDERFMEYDLLIPVDLTKFFRHKMERLQLSIFHYKKGKAKFSAPNDRADNNDQKPISTDDKLPTAENADKNDQKINDIEKECILCLDELYHGEIVDLDGQEASHIFHYKCIKNWFTTSQTIACPICSTKPDLILETHLQPIFYGTKDLYANFYINPLKKLFKISKDQDDKNVTIWQPFQRGQAKLIAEQISSGVKKMDEKVKQMLNMFGFYDDFGEMQLFGINENTGQFVGSESNDFFYSLIEADGQSRGFFSDEEMEMLALLKPAQKVPFLDNATNGIENMQIVDDKEKQQEGHWLMKKFQNLKVENVTLEKLFKGEMFKD